MSSLLLCARCGATLAARQCPMCDTEPPRPSGMERFAVAYAAHRLEGLSSDDAARAAAPIARTRVEA
jgi:hypothetical protein